MSIKFKFTERDTEDYKKWMSFYPKRNRYSPFKFKVERWGYFDPRPQLITSITSILAISLPFISLYFLPISIFLLFFGWGDIYLNLPFDTGKGNESESPEYGMNTYSTDDKIVNELWVYWGKKRKHIDLPWHLVWVRTSLLLKDGTWEHETKGNNKDFYKDEWTDKRWEETYNYSYKLKSGKVQNVLAKVHIKEREWRRKWLKVTKLFNRVDKSIDVEFSQEVGERTGSWKGGVISCGYSMLPKETPEQTLRRMEKERKFN